MIDEKRTKNHWAEWHVAYLSKWGLIDEPLPLPGAILPFSIGENILDRVAKDNGIGQYRRLVPSVAMTATDHEQLHDYGTKDEGKDVDRDGFRDDVGGHDDIIGFTRLTALRSIYSLIMASKTPPPSLIELDPRLENPGPAGATSRPRFWDRAEIASDAWEEVVHAEKLKIVRGYVDRTFRPKEAIRWGEFAAMLIRASYWLPSLED